jgi:hypothetical protein
MQGAAGAAPSWTDNYKIDNSGTTVKTKTLYGKKLYNLNSLPNQTKINLLILRLVGLE